MKYTGINLMCPTYGRSTTRLPEYYNSIIETVSDKTNVFFTFCVNDKDNDTLNWINKNIDQKQCSIITENLPNTHLAKYYNMMYQQTKFQDPAIMVSMCGDDFVFKTKGWDTLLLEWCNAFDGVGLFFGDDCTRMHDVLAVNAFFTRKFVDAISPLPFMCELFPVDGIDVVWDTVAEKIGRKFYIDKLKIIHNHATITGNMDSTWRRMRSQLDESLKGYLKSDDYIDECVRLLNINLKEELQDEPIAVLMTTKDRLEILKTTIDSYNRSLRLPKIIYVFDDNSEDIENVRKECLKLQGVQFVDSKERMGVNHKTPWALKRIFSETEYKAVFVVDSDTLFYKHWWTRINHCYRQLKDDKDFGCVSLINCSNAPGDKTGHAMMVTKPAMGAFGTLFTKEYWKKYIIPSFEQEPNLPWDERSCVLANKDGKKNYSTAPSFLQHIGCSVGAHVGGNNVAYAIDYLGDAKISSDAYVGETDGDKNAILISCMGRHGDIIHLSFYINQLINLGYNVKFLTIPYYAYLVASVCPRVKIIIQNDMPDVDWRYTDQFAMKSQYPGYGYYINAQPGSPEHHGRLIGSGISMIDYVRKIIETALCIDLDRDILKYREYKSPNNIFDLERQKSKLLFIAPFGKSARTMWSYEDIVAMKNKYDNEYDVRILSNDLPDGVPRELRRVWQWRQHLVDVIDLIKQSDLFIGIDSAPAWCSMYSDCKKIIYHRERRMREMNIRYSSIDKNAEDIVVEGT